MNWGFLALRRVGLVAALGLVSCSDPGIDAAAEVAAELRSLRIMLQANGGQAVAAPAVDRAQITNALSPLREALGGLAADQKELQSRQLVLTQELQRWSQLLAQNVTSQAHTEVEALVARLQQLEATLKAQDQRHREVEALLGGALDRTADKLEDFLKRLPSQPGATPAEAKDKDAVPGAAGAESAAPPVAPASKQAGSGEKVGVKVGAMPRPGRHAQTWWWLGVVGLAGLFGLGFAWRLRRGGRAGSAVGQAPRGDPAAEEGPGFDRGVEEIWAAAALLGEAVGRLREAESPATARLPEAGLGSQPGPASPEGGVPEGEWPTDDDYFVLEDGDLEEGETEPAEPPAESPAEPKVAEVAPAEAAPAVVLPRPLEPARPAELACRLRVANPDRAMADVLLLLGSDPRVLRRPQPTVSVHANMLEVHFAVLPALPLGERGQLEQRLRDAVA